jgi:hypothetical protein
MKPFKYSYFQLTFGEEEAYHHPERTYQRLKRFGYDAAELTPPKGRYGADTAAKDGIDYLKLCERVAEYQISEEFPNGYAMVAK